MADKVVKCPECGNRMEKIIFSKVSGIRGETIKPIPGELPGAEKAYSAYTCFKDNRIEVTHE